LTRQGGLFAQLKKQTTQEFAVMGSRKIQSFVSLMAAIFLFAACSAASAADVAAERAARAAKGVGDIVVGVSWPFSMEKATLWEGVSLAQDELNGAGGVLGRKLVLVKEDDKKSVDTGKMIAEKFSSNPDMVAVIGTLNSNIAIETAPVYERAGMVFLSQGSSLSKLTNQGYKNVFRMIPGNRDVGEKLANYAKLKKYKHVLIYYVKNEYGIDLANAFEQGAAAVGVEVTDRVSYQKEGGNYKSAMQHWKDFYSFDAIFLAGSLPESADIIRAAREVGIKAPIFAADGLDSEELIRLGGQFAKDTEITSFFNPSASTPAVSAFRDKFFKRYTKSPDTSAALGYDAVMLLAHAMTRAKTTAPKKVAMELHNLRGWPGVTRTHGFDDAGNALDKLILMQVVKNGKFEYSTIDLGH
jgi:branched-chain amino acid transport system substrate-binding protein